MYLRSEYHALIGKIFHLLAGRLGSFEEQAGQEARSPGPWLGSILMPEG